MCFFFRLFFASKCEWVSHTHFSGRACYFEEMFVVFHHHLSPLCTHRLNICGPDKEAVSNATSNPTNPEREKEHLETIRSGFDRRPAAWWLHRLCFFSIGYLIHMYKKTLNTRTPWGLWKNHVGILFIDMMGGRTHGRLFSNIDWLCR